ncbi:arginine N-methyltransferase 1 [Seminavis robusta]|uniref:Arginine N-methyltransferase 1 n=1 Tax=Seminavis robusta TaxID=568900 RepID=A0A9N8HGW9_9STRA|nr:arginine N-methyltransferase 1 [Seminavis robusta]|eukprot:Sro601_g173560.1 arginine N-methyltransferase 1 (420) ;mRNA; f:36937-38463
MEDTEDASNAKFVNASDTGEIPSFNGDEKAKATDFANYFCSYAQLYHQKQMLADHNRMAAYHSAILGNSSVFKDKVVMDVGTGSGILAVWAAQAGARKVYAVEYTDMAKYAKRVMTANGVDNVVTVIQGAVEDIELPMEEDGLDPEGPVDIMISEWMGYFLLRESMMDSVIRARDKFLNKKTGLMFPSHCSMFVAPVRDEDDRKQNNNEYAGAMSDWHDFAETTRNMYGVDMDILEKDFDREQKEYYLLSSRWTELQPEVLLAEPKMIKQFDMATCTLEEARGITAGEPDAVFCFDINGTRNLGPVSAIAGWFTSDFRSRTDEHAAIAPKIENPSFLSTGPEQGYTHWGQQTFYLLSPLPLLKGEITRLEGSIEMTRTKENARLYNCKFKIQNSRRRLGQEDGQVLMKSPVQENVYQIP